MLSSVPPPPIPTAVPPPGTPYRFKATLKATGAVEMSFKCDNPAGSQGTIYQIYRAIGDAEPIYLGGTGTRKFADLTLPAGTAVATYSIQAVRSTAVGEVAEFLVKLGVGGGGAATVSSVEAKPLTAKVAA